MGVDHFETNEVHILNTSSSRVSPATEDTLAAMLTEATFTAEDFAQEATLEAARVLIDSLDTKFDVSLSTRASEATVATLLTEATFVAEDFAQETTLEAVRLLLASLDGKDFSTETTLATFAAANTADLNAIEADIEAFKTAFDSRDLATNAAQTDGSQRTGIIDSLGNNIDPAEQQSHSRDTNNEQTSPLVNGAPVNFSADDTADTILATAHGVIAGKVVHLTTTGTLPVPLEIETDYWVINPNTDDFQLSESEGGDPIDITDTGTGTHSYSVAGEFEGAYTKVDDIDHTEILYAATTPLASVQKIWSNDGVNPLGGDIGTSTLTVQEVPSDPLVYNVVYDIGEGRNIAPYYKLKVINGHEDQNAFPLLIHIAWLIKTPYQGTFTFKDEGLTNLSKFLLTRSIGIGQQPDGDLVNSRADGLAVDVDGNYVEFADDIGGDQVVQSGWVDSDQWNTLGLVIESDVPGSGVIEYTNNAQAISPRVIISEPFTYGPEDSIAGQLVRNLDSEIDGFRVTYTNGPSAASPFYLSVTLRKNPRNPTNTLASQINKTSKAVMTRGAIFAEGSDGSVQLIGRDGFGNAVNTHVKEIDDDVHIRPLEAVQARQFTVGASPVQIDLPKFSAPGKRRAIGIQTRGPNWSAYGFTDGIAFDSQSMMLPPNSYKSIALDDGIDVWMVTEQTGGSQVTHNLDGSAATGTATDPSNVLVSDNSRASLDAAGENIEVDGFSYTPTADSVVESVAIIAEIRKAPTPASAIATLVETQVGETTGAVSISSAALAGGTSQLYVAYITRNDLNAISAVTGPGGESFQVVPNSQNIQGGGRRIDAWYFFGDIDPGAVTASMSTSTSGQISVHRITGADPINPIQASDATASTGVSVTGPNLAKTDRGVGLLGVSHEGGDNSATPGSGYTEQSDESIGTGANTVALATESKQFTITGSEAATMTIPSSQWLAIGITVVPGPTDNPVFTLSYETPSGTPGATSGQFELSNTSDTIIILDITGDQGEWTESEIEAIVAILTMDTAAEANLEPDHLFVRVVDTTGNTNRISVEQYAGADA